jgi:hypothetical protein
VGRSGLSVGRGPGHVPKEGAVERACSSFGSMKTPPERLRFADLVYLLGSELRRELFVSEDLALRQARGISWAFTLILAATPARIRARLAAANYFFDRAHANLLIESVEALAVYMAMVEIGDEAASLEAMGIASDRLQRAAAMELSKDHLVKIREHSEERTRALWRAT